MGIWKIVRLHKILILNSFLRLIYHLKEFRLLRNQSDKCNHDQTRPYFKDSDIDLYMFVLTFISCLAVNAD